MKPSLLFPALATAFALGCVGGSETGNPAVPTTLALTLHSSDDSVATVQGADGLVVESAWIHISELSFVLAANCALANDDDDEVELPGPFVVQLTDSTANIRDLLLTSRDYCGLEVDLERAGRNIPDGAPAELRRNTLVVTGHTPAGTPFAVVTQEEFELEVTSLTTHFTVDELTNHLLLSFDVARWFETLDLDALTPGDDGVIRVSLTENTPTLLLFEANVQAAMELARDANGNGELDDEDDVLVRGDD